ncbi:Radical SAM superfamily protein [Caloramator mitchellensis]|uniref:Radical SAM superfamily protein n=1 Tax=Caloramator mitchellensis TaxID=908809 RepID=A0A0R3JTE0_CALMK|nr:radical SAM protein [Caloramator mitchellensis]KRQ86744.1 Radical SAM superfamily protein [Caloramator mitchellensis]
MSCNLCPRSCRVDRNVNKGYCNSIYTVKVAKAFLHQWEEPSISGENGSGTVFFSNCNLKCVFCQNFKISHEGFGVEVTTNELSKIFLRLQEKGAHNINLVTPTHYILQIKEALILAKENGLSIPIVYNSNGYENVEGLKELEGLVDIYLPDIKYYDDKYSIKYSNAPGYFKVATEAVLEMYRQVGEPIFEDGLLKKGLMIRHMMLPGLLFDSKKIIDWVAKNLPRSVYFNIMCQYTPMYRAVEFQEINKRVNPLHYESLVDYALLNGLENGYFQEYESATEEYVPNFDLEGIF